MAGIDIELLTLSFISWACGIVSPQGRHLAIDGKGLRAAASKVRDETTPYMLNVIDVTTKLVVAQVAIREKTNEKAMIPEVLKLLEAKDSVITVDAIGTTSQIMNTVCGKGGHFVLQVKKNCPQLYEDIMKMFDGLKNEKGSGTKAFLQKYGEVYSEWAEFEINRERHEYREARGYHEEDAIEVFREARPHIGSIGYLRQVRIKVVRERDGTDITPGLEEFLKYGSRRQPKPVKGDEADSDIMEIGLISDLVLSAEEMAAYKREHWAIENSLHYILDDVFREDRSTIRKGKTCAAVLRKIAYNIVRLIDLDRETPAESFIGLADEIAENWKTVMPYILKPVPAIV